MLDYQYTSPKNVRIKNIGFINMKVITKNWGIAFMEEYDYTVNQNKRENNLSTESLNSISIILLNYSKQLKETPCNPESKALPSTPQKEKEKKLNE